MHALLWQFLDIMKAFRTKSIGTIDVIDRVIDLFSGNRAASTPNEFILGFNTFLVRSTRPKRRPARRPAARRPARRPAARQHPQRQLRIGGARRAMLTPPTVWCALVPPRSQPCGYKIEFEEIHDGEEKAPAILLKMKEALGGDATTSVDDALKRAFQARLFASFAISLTLPCYLISPPLPLAS